MKIAYIYPEQLPSKKARAVSVINSANEISKISKCSLFIDMESDIDSIVKNYNLNDSKLYIEKVSKKAFGIKSNKFFNKNLLKELKKEKVEIIYVRHLKAAKYIIKNKKSGQKVVFESHEIFYQTLQEEHPDKTGKIKKLKALEEYVYKNCDGLVFVNKTLQNSMNNTFPLIQSKQAVVYNGMNFDERYIKKDFSHINDIYYIGNFFKWKGLQEAIRVIKYFDNLSLQVVGGDSEHRTLELQALVNDLNIEDKINFNGYKKSDEVKDILQNRAKLTVIPNIKSVQNEFSMPIKLFEYMATSNIVIAADMDTIKEVVIDSENGFLFKSGDLDSLRDTIDKVLSLSNETLQKIAKNAYETSKNFTWQKRAEKILEFIKDIKD